MADAAMTTSETRSALGLAFAHSVTLEIHAPRVGNTVDVAWPTPLRLDSDIPATRFPATVPVTVQLAGEQV